MCRLRCCTERRLCFLSCIGSMRLESTFKIKIPSDLLLLSSGLPPFLDIQPWIWDNFQLKEDSRTGLHTWTAKWCLDTNCRWVVPKWAWCTNYRSDWADKWTAKMLRLSTILDEFYIEEVVFDVDLYDFTDSKGYWEPENIVQFICCYALSATAIWHHRVVENTTNLTSVIYLWIVPDDLAVSAHWIYIEGYCHQP